MKIVGIAAAVPKEEVNAESFVNEFGEEAVSSSTKNTGIFSWRRAASGICTSDLAYNAAEELFAKLHVERSSIDALIFVSQTADYMIPATSPILQKRLGLKDTLFTLDVNKGCTGYTDGLLLAHSLMKGMGFKRILLLVGDTLSKIVDSSDKGTCLLFGDAAAATLVEADSQELLFFVGRDGTGSEFIHQKIGYRNELCCDSLVKSSDLNLMIDGAEIFNFTIKRIPSMIKALLEVKGWQISDVDAFVFHQANKFIIKHLARKIRLDVDDKVPMSLKRFGNTSSASIPLTLVTEMRWKLSKPVKLILVGFGVGLAWSSVAVESENIVLCPLVEV